MLIIHNSIPSTRRQDLETDCELLWVDLFWPIQIFSGSLLQPSRGLTAAHSINYVAP